jgi:hypothetical protein
MLKEILKYDEVNIEAIHVENNYQKIILERV